MSVEFVDTNLLIYAYDLTAGAKREIGSELLARLRESSTGALSIQVLAEFYSVWTRKLNNRSQEAEEIILDLGAWTIHSPVHADLLRASQLHRQHQISWWDAMIVNSAMELGASILWTEDMKDGQAFGGVAVRNPFR